MTWALFALILIGTGSLVLEGFALAFDADDVLWTGLMAFCVFLEIWNLFFAVSVTPDFLLTGAAAWGLYRNRRWLVEKAQEIASHRALLVIYAFLVAGIAFRAAGPCEYYDTGLYGASLVRWIQTYPTVFGLANVHGRLGFNSSVFLIDAALAEGPWKGFYFHLFGGFLLCVLWALILPSCWRVIRGTGAGSADWFRSILGVALLIWSARGVVVGTTTDEPSTVLCLAAAAVIFEEIERARSAEADEACRLLRVAVGTTLLALAVTFKLSVVVFAFLAWCVGLGILYAARRQSRLAWAAIGGAAVVLVPWAIARVILSGYPFFPNSSFAFPGDWRVPRAVAEMYEQWVRSWGRTGTTSAEGFAWVRPWLHEAVRDRTGLQVPMALSAVSAAILAIARASGRWKGSRGMWLALVAVSGVLFWFWKSPDPRFGQPAIWTLAATLGSLAIGRVLADSGYLRARMIVAGLGLVTMWCLFSFGWRHSYQVLESVHGFVPLPEANVRAERTLSGLSVYVPVGGNQCWDAPLPCTPYFTTTLRLRSGSDIRWGFVGVDLPELRIVRASTDAHFRNVREADQCRWLRL